MKQLIIILTFGMMLCASACSNSAQQAEVNKLTDSLTKAKKNIAKLQSVVDSFKYQSLLSHLKKVGFNGDTIAVKDTASYRVYLATCKTIKENYNHQVSLLYEGGIYDKNVERQKQHMFKYLVTSLKGTDGYQQFVDALIYDHFNVSLDDYPEVTVNESFDETWQLKFDSIDKLPDPIYKAWDAGLTKMLNMKDVQLKSAWVDLKTKNLPLKKK
jgi:hypothetical protein